MFADEPPAAVSLCELARSPTAYAERTVSLHALVIRTPGGGARLLDPGRPGDDACAISVEIFPPDAKNVPARPDRSEAELTALVSIKRRVDFGFVVVNYALSEVGVVRWGR